MMRVVNNISQMTKRQMSIKNIEVKLCKNCVHFTNRTTNDDFGPLVDDISLGRCKLFGDINLVTGEMKYSLAQACRFDVAKCGIVARHFK